MCRPGVPFVPMAPMRLQLRLSRADDASSHRRVAVLAAGVVASVVSFVRRVHADEIQASCQAQWWSFRSVLAVPVSGRLGALCVPGEKGQPVSAESSPMLGAVVWSPPDERLDALDFDGGSDEDGPLDDVEDISRLDGGVGMMAEVPSGSVPSEDEGVWSAWIGRIVMHDEQALTALYDAASRRVYALVLRITQDAAMADEVVEDTFWQVWRQAPRFDAARGQARTWLMAMARSRAIDALRRQARFRHERWPRDGDEGAAAEDATLVPQPPDLLDLTRTEHRLHQALRELDAGPRQLVALAFFKGLTHEEIAEITGQPLGTVKSQIRRALRILKQRLNALGMVSKNEFCSPTVISS